MVINPADIVISKAGRDKGKIFIVLSLENEQFAYIADGGLRKISKPKKKKLKHLKLTGKKADFALLKMQNGEEITNRELKKFLREL